MSKAVTRALAGALHLIFVIPAAGAEARPAAATVAYSGAIRSFVTGRPLPGASVYAYPRLSTEEIRARHAGGDFDLAPLATASTDASGRFSIAVPAGETIVIAADAPGHARMRLGRSWSASMDRELGSFDLDRGRAVRGKVVDAAGKPVGGAILVAIVPPEPLRAGRGAFRMMNQTQPEFPVFGRSRPDGSFELSGLPEDRVELHAYAPGHAPALVEDLRAASGLTIRLKAGASLKGNVVRSDGKRPAGGAWVLAGGDLGWDGAVRAEEDGRFDLANARPGAITLMAAGGSPDETPGTNGKPAASAADLSFEAPSREVTVSVPSAADTEGAGKDAATAGQGAKSKPVVLRLRAGGLLETRVIDDETRKPIRGARVVAIVDGERRPREEMAGRGGEAVFPGVPTGTLMIFADADEYFGQRLPSVSIAAGHRRATSAALKPAALVEGIVRDMAGKPIAGAVISVGGPPPAGMRMPVKMSFPIGVDPVTSDLQGRFIFEKLPPGEPLSFDAMAPGYVAWKLEDLKLKPHEKNRSMEILLDAGTSLMGRLVNEDGEPVAYASVTASRKPEGGQSAFVFRVGQRRRRGGGSAGNLGDEDLPPVLSDDKGRFLVGGVRDGVWTLDIRAPGFAPYDSAGLKVENSEGVDAGDITLEPGATIRGHVQNANGEPIPYAQISVAKTFMPFASATADSGGFFETEDLTPGDVVNLSVSADGYGSAEVPGQAAPVDDVQVVLPFASTVSGQVLDKQSREPLTDFQINVAKSRSMGGGGMSMVMEIPGPHESFQSEDGRFSVEGIDPGKITVTASATGYKSAVLRDLEVAAGENLGDLVLVLDRGAIISGTVTDDRGRPVAGASVRKKETSGGRFGGLMRRGDGESTTDGDGNFTLEGLDREPMTLSVEMDGYEPADVDVDTTHDVEGLGIVLTSGATLTGVVLRSDDGSPVAGATVTASAAGTGFLGGAAPVTTGPDGSFEMEGLAAGRYTLRAESNGLIPAEVDDVVLRSGAPTAPVELRLAGGVTVTGTVTGTKPDEAANLSVRAYTPGRGGFGVTAPADASGAFELKGLSTGSYTLIASTGFLGGRSASKTIEIPEGTTTMETTIEFPKGSRVSGEVTRGGAPVAGASVIFFKTSSRARATVTTDASGKYTAEDLDDGDYSVTVMQMQTGLSHSTSLTVDGDEDFDIELPLAKLAGQVRDAQSGEPIEGATIALKRTDEGGSSSSGFRFMGSGNTTDASGYFELGGLDDGLYDVTASKEGYGFRTQNVQIIPGADPGALTFDLSPVEGFTFRALDGLTGAPLRTIFALAIQGGGDPLAPGGSGARVAYRGSLSADGAGLFKLSSLQPGTYTIVLGGSSLATLTMNDVKVPAQQQAITLPKGGTIEVRCASLSGNDTAKAVLVDASGRPVFVDTWDGEASFTLRPGTPSTLRDIPPGAYTLRAALPGGIVEQSVAVDAGGSAKVDLP